MEQKKLLAVALVERFHSLEEAVDAQNDFMTRFSARNLESANLPSLTLPAENNKDLVSVVSFAFESCFGVSRSRSDVRRLIEQGSIQWNGEKLTNPKMALPEAAEGVLRLDKTRAVRLNP